MNLSDRAMLASLTIRRWQATLTDKKVTRDVATAHSVSARRAGHYRKHAIDVDAPAFKAVGEAASALRHRHYELTLPWGQDGARILTAAMFETYSSEMRHLRASFDVAVKAFLAEYPRLRESARKELNGLFNDTDYPRRIEAKFGIDLSIMPLPNSQDFRVSLAADVTDEIKKNIDDELQKTTAIAMREPYERLYAHIARMVERLGDPKGIFRDSLISGLGELCSILPGLNLTGDAVLEDLRKRAEAMIAGVDVDQLRQSPTVRTAVAKRAQEIHDAMSVFMTPSEGGDA